MKNGHCGQERGHAGRGAPRRRAARRALAAGIWLLVLGGLLLGSAMLSPARASVKEDLRAGFLNMRLGHCRQAVRLITQAIESGYLERMELISALQGRSRCYRRLRWFKKAVKDLERALRLAKGHTSRAQRGQIHLGLGMVYYRWGHYDQAIREFNRSLRLNPANPRTFFYRGNAWRLKHNFPRALKDYDRALALEHHHRYYYQRSQVLVRMGRIDEAIADMKTAVRLRPGYQSYRRRLGYLKSLKKTP